jgi:hypothetical protein
MNPALIFVLAILIPLIIVAAYLGRKEQEWKNLARIVVGVGGLVVVFRVLLASQLDQWTKVGVIVLVAATLGGLSVCKSLARSGR